MSLRRFPFKSVLALLIVGGLSAASYKPAVQKWKDYTKPNYRFGESVRGPITLVVNATGTIKPVQEVQVGAFVSGPILKLYADFNDRVKKDDLLAKIDPRIYDANLARDEAALATRMADVKRVEALLQQAKNDELRSQRLRELNKDFISDTEMDQFKFNRMSLEAQLIVANASVEQAKAARDTSHANVIYTEIVSPVNGIVIDRKIDEGQTLASQFQTPQLFIVAPDMDKKMLIFANVDEADIGLVREAQLHGQPVKFTVDAYPDDLFVGSIDEVRMSSTSTQNVVTYPVVVAAPNPDLKLLPGMTASLSFQIQEKTGVLKIPNAALRFYPEPRLVRPQDRAIVEGTEVPETEGEDSSDVQMSAVEKAETNRQRNRRHVWVVEGDFLRAIEVVTGLSDSKFTEIVSGEISEGQKFVTGIRPKTPGA
jgi:HlyD family secretion protein